MATIRIKRIRTLTELDTLEKIWTELERLDGGPSIFQSWTWNRLWCEEVLLRRKRAYLDVRVVEDGAGRALAVLPLFTEALAGPMVRITQFLGHRMSFHKDVLLADPKSPELADIVIRALLQDLGSSGVLHLRHLDGESMFTKRLVVNQVAEPQCTRLYLQADPTITDQRMRLGPSRRSSLRRGENRLRRQFDIAFRVQSGMAFLEAFDELIDLHHRRFTAKGSPTSLIGPSLAFFRTATSTLSKAGNCEIIQLQANGVTIAAVLMACHKRRYFFLQSGFDPKFSRFSPMRLLLTESMRRGFEDLRCEIYDLGTGYEQYKFDWSPIVGTNYMCCRGGTSLYARSVAAFYRAAFLYYSPSSTPPVT
jgi:CelD/BcsL family acetyltransferase involved in cellulose biosynthesis